MQGIQRSRLLSGLVLACLSGSALAQVKVIVNGDPLEFTGQGPTMMGGRVLVPLRAIMEKLGAEVNFEGSSQTVRAVRGSSDLELTIGQRSAKVDGRTITLDQPAQVVNGATLVPLRFVGEALGANVKWIGSTQTVRISTDGNPIPEENQQGGKSGGGGGGQIAPRLVGMTPADGSRVADRTPTITATFRDDQEGIDRASVRLMLNGRDVTPVATKGDNQISFTPVNPLRPGQHTVGFSVRDLAGNRLQKNWTFTVGAVANAANTFTVQGPRDPQPGEVLRFRVVGEPRARSVTVSVGGILQNLPLRESSPGVYTGIYTVRTTDVFRGERPVLRMLTATGELLVLRSPEGIGEPSH